MNITCCTCSRAYNVLFYPNTPILLINELPRRWEGSLGDEAEILDTTSYPQKEP